MPLVDSFSMTAVGLVNDPHNIRMQLRIAVRNCTGLIHRSVIHQDNFNIFATLEQGIYAVLHICRRVVTGNGKCNQFHLVHSPNADYRIPLGLPYSNTDRFEIKPFSKTIHQILTEL